MDFILATLRDRLRFKQSSLGTGKIGVLLIAVFLFLSLWTLHSTWNKYLNSFQEQASAQEEVDAFLSQLEPGESIASDRDAFEVYMNNSILLKTGAKNRMNALNTGLILSVFCLGIAFTLAYNRRLWRKFLKPYNDKGPGFTELKSHEKGFSLHYQEKIAPALAQLEKYRLQQKHAHQRRMFLAIPLGLGLVCAGFALDVSLGMENAPFSIAGVILASFLLSWAYTPVFRFKKEIKSKFMPTICRFYGEFTYKQFDHDCDLEDKYKDYLFPFFDFSTCEDVIRGVYKGVELTIHESTLQRKVRNHGYTYYPRVFRGLIICLKFRKKLVGKTLIFKENILEKWFRFFMRRVLKAKRFTDLDPVVLEDPRFEHLFEVLSSDQVEARFVLTTSFMERLIALARLRGRGKTAHFTCGFRDQEMLIAFPGLGEDLFEPQSIYTSTFSLEDLHLFLDQLHHVFDLVDALQLEKA